MNSNSVHLIATDPPFNKGRDFHATPDSLASGASFHDRWNWEDDVEQEWVDQITDDWPHVMNVIQGSRNSYGDDMGAFLCYMAVRLIAMRRVLRDDGSIYLHCDPTASHYLKELMDAVFGKKNFLNEIVWCYSTSGRAKRTFARKHDAILFYAKSNRYFWADYRIPISQKYLDSHYRQTDAQGRRCRIRIDHGKERIYYPSEGMTCNDWWTEFPYVNSQAKERTGHPTQKPLDLYARMIEASSSEGDIVLDPFAGCATTCIAAEKLQRQWVGVDIWKGAHEVVRTRLENEVGLLGEVHYTTEPPERTDDGEMAAPFLKTKKRVDEPKGRRMSRAEMVAFLLEQNGQRCQGCDREFDDPRYLELDHNTPRADGGINHISNRILLCGPCNRAKSHTLTLSGLRRLNRQNGWMAGG
ncbi:MAG: DNA methyltransferase [Gemmatimonadota bacterium]|nr:DNA methyltransferase [Gemmatimonadota bacterium]